MHVLVLSLQTEDSRQRRSHTVVSSSNILLYTKLRELLRSTVNEVQISFLSWKTMKLSECLQNLPFLFSLNLSDILAPKQRHSSCLSPASLHEPSLSSILSLFSISNISLFAAHTICLSRSCFLNSSGLRRGFSQ